MKKILFLLVLLSTIAYAQDTGSILFVSPTTSQDILLENGYRLSELYFPTGFDADTIYLNVGDIADTTNFVVTQSISGSRITITGISAPCRVYFTESILPNSRSWTLVGNGSDSSHTVYWKSEIK